MEKFLTTISQKKLNEKISSGEGSKKFKKN